MFSVKSLSILSLTVLICASPLRAARMVPQVCETRIDNCTVMEKPGSPMLLSFSWKDVVEWITGKKGSKTRRDDDVYFCLVSPGILENPVDPLRGTSNQVMTRQPLFFWNQEKTSEVAPKVVQIELYEHGRIEPIWKRDIEPGHNSVVYDGAVPLVPNILGYYWELTLDDSPIKKPRKTFNILDEKKTTEIQQKFDRIEREDIPEQQKTLRRIEILSQEKYGLAGNEALGADVIAEIFRLETFPQELSEFKTRDHCKDNIEEVTSLP